MKRVIFISIVAILLIAVLVIFVIPVRCIPAPLTLWDKWQVSKELEHDSMSTHYQYYFGKYGGYYVVSSAKNTCAFSITTIGEHTFCFNSYNIGVWKDGMRFNLEDAYKQGKISDKDLEKIHKYHLKTLRDFELKAVGESAGA